jgi:hypothetical protein
MYLPDSGHSASNQAARDRESQTVSAKIDRIRAFSVSIQSMSGGIIACGVNMLMTAERLEEERSRHSLDLRYESLIRLVDAIRSQGDLEDLFQVVAVELQKVVPFDVMAQCDHTGNKVYWHFSAAMDSAMDRSSDVPKEESVGWSVYRTQRPLVIQVTDAETPFCGHYVRFR